jgi:uncharacterized delta-60 repeat protein
MTRLTGFMAVLCGAILACSGGAVPTAAPGEPTLPGQTLAPGVTLAPGTTAGSGQPTPGQPTDAIDTPLIDGRRLGGTVSGLQGSGFVIYALGEELPIAADGPFQFTQPLPDGAIYAVRVITQPKSPDQSCQISQGNGTIFGLDVTDIEITCAVVTVATGLDPAFGAGGKVATVLAKGQGEAMVIQPDGNIVVAGRALGESSFDFAVLRYLANGSLDTGFGSGGVATVDITAGSNDEAFGVALQPDGKIVVVGTSRVGATDDFAVARWHPDGTLDADFGTDGVLTTDIAGGPDGAQAVAIQADGAIVVAGNAGNAGNDNDFGVVRYLADGTLDPAFGNGGKVTTNIAGMTDLGQALAITAEGMIVVAGRVAIDGGAPSDFGLVRYLADGTPDPAFGNGGIVQTDFASDSDDNPFAVVSDGSTIVVGGYSFGGATGSDFALARYAANGTLDPSFGNGGLVTTDFGIGEDYGHALAVGPGGVIAMAGQATSATIQDLAIARYSATGVLDTTLGANGLVTVDFYGSGDLGRAVAFVGTSVLAAGYTANGSTTEIVLVRTTP